MKRTPQDVYELHVPGKVKFAFDFNLIDLFDTGNFNTMCRVFDAYAIDSHRWEYVDSYGEKHNGETFIMPDYLTFESLWDFEYVDEFMPWSGCAEYLCPEMIWKDAEKFNIAKR